MTDSVTSDKMCQDVRHEVQLMVSHILACVKRCGHKLQALRTVTLRFSTNEDNNDARACKDLVPRYLMKTLICPLAAECPSRNLLFIGSFEHSSIKDPQLEQLETFHGLFANQPRV